MSSHATDLTSTTHIDWEEPIVALSSATGLGARAILRLTGHGVWSVVRQCLCDPSRLPDAPAAGRWHIMLAVPHINDGLPAQLLAWRGPRSYTGQDLVELHTLSSPALTDLLLAECLRRGARLARPGEFTLRAFLNGKLDLTQAEALRGVIEAGQTEELRAALGQLAGGVTRPLHDLRDSLLTLLADVEAGLDFAEEDLTFVSRDRLVHSLRQASSTLERLQEQLQARSVHGRVPRVVLAGHPNVGKSSLFNALLGRPAALVSPEPGTTRDYVSERVTWQGMEIELVDTAGEEPATTDATSLTTQAQAARLEQRKSADLLLRCAEHGAEFDTQILASPASLDVQTKADLHSSAVPQAGMHRTSARTGEGIAELRRAIVTQLGSQPHASALAPSLSRCRHHVDTGLAHLHEAESLTLQSGPPELLALELRSALEQVGEIAGTVYTEDLLDRVFSQFCIGK
jgi:tRNA modification GTPase